MNRLQLLEAEQKMLLDDICVLYDIMHEKRMEYEKAASNYNQAERNLRCVTNEINAVKLESERNYP